MAIPHSMNYGYNEVDSTPVEDSTDSDSHCERALCLSSQEGHDGHSTCHEFMDKTHKSTRYSSRGGFRVKTTWTQLLWRTARTLTLIARGHCACHPRKAMVASPQTMIAWIKPTKSTRYSSRGGFTATDRGLMGSHRSTGYSSPGGFMVTNDVDPAHVDPAPVEDSTDSDSHCERALCLSSQEGQGGQSTDHDCMDKTHKIHTLQQPWWIYSHRPWAYGFPQIYRL